MHALKILLVIAFSLSLTLTTSTVIADGPDRVELNDDRILDPRGDYEIQSTTYTIQIKISEDERGRLRADILVVDIETSRAVAGGTGRFKARINGGVPEIEVNGRTRGLGFRGSVKLTGTYNRETDVFDVQLEIDFESVLGNINETIDGTMSPVNEQRGATLQRTDEHSMLLIAPTGSFEVGFRFNENREGFRFSSQPCDVSVPRITGFSEGGTSTHVESARVRTQFGEIMVEPENVHFTLSEEAF